MKTVRILVTGSREWDDRETLEAALYRAVLHHTQGGQRAIIVHGDNPRGADRMAREWAVRVGSINGCPIAHEPHDADWSLGKRAGPIRNQRMVDLGADLCLAFPAAKSIGTWDCIKRANRAGIPVRIVPQRAKP